MKTISRRTVLQAGAGLGLTLSGFGSAGAAASRCGELLCRTIPSTAESLPVIGVGTNRFGSLDRDGASSLLQAMYDGGGRVIDTAALYRGSEEVIGQALVDLGLQQEMFVATKFNAAGASFAGGRSEPKPGDLTAEDSFKRSLDWLQMERVDLLFAHFVSSVEPLMSQMVELKEKGLTKYIGITSVQRAQHQQVMKYMREYPIDFLQIDYSIGNRETALDVLPLAAERDIAVMVAVPFGGRRRSLFADLGDRQVPEWAQDFGAQTWGQFFLKYIVAHPAVTCVIPGTTKEHHMQDNLAAASGPLPDAATLRRMETYWDELQQGA